VSWSWCLAPLLAAILSASTPAAERDPGQLLPRISDLTGETSISVIVVGDSGAKPFTRVGAAIAEHCAAQSCQLAVLLGDNFYLRPFGQGPVRARSRAFESRFAEPLRGLGPGFDVWAVMGNHGYLLWASATAQIKHSYLARPDGDTAPDWLMPGNMFEIPKLPPWLTIVGADTQLVLKKPRLRGDHLAAVENAFQKRKGSDGWRVLVGHHPFHSSGAHGRKDEREQRNLWAHMGSLVETHEIDVVFSGHDHHQEFIQADDFVQVIQGAGSKLRDEVREKPLTNGATCRFFSKQHRGFSKATFTEATLTIEYFGVSEGGKASPLRSFVCRRGLQGMECTPTSHQSEGDRCPVS
jgi:hypothetical protein